MYSRRWLIIALAVCTLTCACDSFNTNLTTQTSSSQVTFLNPASATVGSVPATGLQIVINGAGFVGNALIVWNVGPNQVTFTPSGVSSTQLAVTIPASFFATPGTVPLAVQLPGSAVSGASGAGSSTTTEVSNIVNFTVCAVGSPPCGGTTPTVTSLSPSSIGAGSAAFTLTVTGTNFVTGASASVLNWNNMPITPTTVTNATTLSAKIPASDVATIGTASVSVSNAASSGSTSTPATFTITSAAPSMAAILQSNAVSSATDVLQSSPGVSADRRFVVFAMASSDGITETPGLTQNIFVRDTCTGGPQSCVPATSLASTGLDGQLADGDSTSPSISADGRYVAFVSSATNLVDGDTNGVDDVFVRDTCTGAPAGCAPSMQRVSVASDGTQANFASESSSISATGRYVTFRSQATNLDPALSSGSSGFSAIFVRDTCTGVPAGCTPSTQLLNLQN
jgi:hypothetical protein